jgi:hypothetical protein
VRRPLKEDLDEMNNAAPNLGDGVLALASRKASPRIGGAKACNNLSLCEHPCTAQWMTYAC